MGRMIFFLSLLAEGVCYVEQNISAKICINSFSVVLESHLFVSLG